VPAQRPVLVRDLITFTWGFGMQGAMFLETEPWPIFTATLDRRTWRRSGRRSPASCPTRTPGLLV
jgi:hypothetical protein